MRFLILSTFLLASAAICRAQSTSGTAVEIEKQRLIRFPEDADTGVPVKAEKADEAKRILEQIAKVNEAFGYVKKSDQPEKPKLPALLDSSQYLYPKPANQPFHAQQHHFAGSHGQTLLEPSIRAVKLTRGVSNGFNVPPRSKQSPAGTTSSSSSSVEQSKPQQLYFRPNQVLVPRPSSAQEAAQLPTHFAIPVRLYKLNKEQYLREHAPREYRVKGYKIVGDVNSFYGKAKSMAQKQGKSTPKYHLFFLPRELALSSEVTAKQSKVTASAEATGSANNTKESRFEDQQRPLRLPLNALSNNAQDANTRKRVSQKPQRNKDAQLHASAKTEPQSLNANASGKTTSTSTTQQPHKTSTSTTPSSNRLSPFRVTNVLGDMQNQTSTAIKNAFQNIFKLPFRAPAANTAAQPALLENVPLQMPHQAFGQLPQLSQLMPLSSASDSLPDDYKWDDEREGGGDGAGNSDTIEQTENNAAEQDSSAAAEKHLFAHKKHNLMSTVGHIATAHHGTQKQALREGGIIIQRLKVRKGGIAIAGPGGVATAGSGGTAIVGPGGYALTHPRSLTIAGPGAKVIAIPPDVDLKDALQRTNLESKSFPREGKIVATGPTVYYAPPTGMEAETVEA